MYIIRFEVSDPNLLSSMGPELKIEINTDNAASSSSSASALPDANILLFDSTGFIGVCSVQDMLTYPASPSSQNGLYRSNTATLSFRSTIVLARAQQLLVDDVNKLQQSLTYYEELQSPETLSVNLDSEAGSSSSNSKYISITRQAITMTGGSFVLSVSAGGAGVDTDIFYHRIEPKAMYRPIGVCSLADMESYPVGAANVVSFPKFFRADLFEVKSVNLEELYTGWVNLKADFLQYTTSLKAYANGPTSITEETV
jgi:hypothetical protein